MYMALAMYPSASCADRYCHHTNMVDDLKRYCCVCKVTYKLSRLHDSAMRMIQSHVNKCTVHSCTECKS